MIFVTVGTHNQGFERLIKKMDEIAGKINEEVVMQIGFNDYEPENAKWFKFVDIEEIMNFYKNADIIVTHAGAGALLDALSFGKLIIVVPRLKKFREHIDNQQLELAEALENKGQIKAVYKIEDLERVFKENNLLDHSIKSDKGLMMFLKEYVGGIRE
jgi:beta-1,4-N-acetylglucosaminyltransferase